MKGDSEMTVEEYLNSVKRHVAVLRIRRLELKSIRDAMDITGVSYEQSGAKPTRAGSDKLGGAVARAIDFENAVKAEEAQLIDERLEATRLISKLADLHEREVLVAYYLADQSLDAIATTMGYSKRRVYQLRRTGLANLADVF